MAGSATKASRGTVGVQISNGMVRILADTTGRGPTKARTTIARDHVIVMLADTLTRGEQNLVAAGHVDDVIAVRQRYQGLMRTRAVEMVEGLLDRRVIGFMSDNNIAPDLGVEIFILDPAGADGLPAEEADSDRA